MSPRVTVVTIAHGRRQHLELQHRSLSICATRPDAYVVVAMGDPDLVAWRPARGLGVAVLDHAADPARLPLAAARNRGARRAFDDGADVVVFLDVDCVAGEGLVPDYAAAVLERPDVVWSGPVTYLPSPPPVGYDLCRLDEVDDPHPARPMPRPGERLVGTRPDLFWSLSFALGREAWAAVGGFCEDYVGYGGEDTDFAQLVQAAGLGLGWTGGARAYHQHHPVESPPVRHVDDILRNGRIFQQRWGRWPMLGWLEAFERRGLVRAEGDDWTRVSPAARDDRG